MTTIALQELERDFYEQAIAGTLPALTVTNKLIARSGSKISGPVYTELGLSLLDQGRSPSWQANTNNGVSPTLMRKYDQKGVSSWLKRWTKNGFTFLETAGKSGDTAAGCLDRIYDEVINQDILPNIVNIWVGGNEINAITSQDAADAALIEMKTNLDAILNILEEYGIEVILSVLPNNGLWPRGNYAMRAQCDWEQYLIEMGRKNRFKALLNFGPLLADPEAVWPTTGLSMTRASNVVTVSWPGHNMTTGDRVNVYEATNVSFITSAQPVGAEVTVINGATFTYPNTGPNATTTGSAVKINILQDLASDKTTHLLPRGASKAAHMVKEIFLNLFPARDILSASENDYYNLVGVGKTTTARRQNIGMMYGTGGTKSGTPTPTGSVARSHEVKVVNGNPASVVCSIEADDSIGLSQYLWQRIDITAGVTDCEVSLEISQSRPNAWAPSAPLNDSFWVRPTVENGYFYVNVSGTTGTLGTTEPTWPTRIGERVTNGTCELECRLGFIPGVTKSYAAAAYKIPAMDDGAIHCLSFGIIDNTTGADSILDFNNNQDDFPPYYTAGEEGHFCTPEAVLGDSGDSYTIATKVRVAANKTASIMVARETWRVVE